MIPAGRLQALAGVCQSVEEFQEGAVTYVYLSNVKIKVAGSPFVVDALLCPSTHAGYTTRLFLSQPFPQRAANWTVHQILGRAWHSWSWQGVPADLPLEKMLLCHLDALK
jgi:hypothetical protein